jgi:hypothetical protein
MTGELASAWTTTTSTTVTAIATGSHWRLIQQGVHLLRWNFGVVTPAYQFWLVLSGYKIKNKTKNPFCYTKHSQNSPKSTKIHELRNWIFFPVFSVFVPRFRKLRRFFLNRDDGGHS